MTLIRVSIALGLTLAGWAAAAEPAVRAWEGSIVLPTWDEGPAEAIPHFAVLGAERAWYPYPLRTALGQQSRKATWRTLNLENEYLTCVILPDLGGHLYSCRDKLSGYEMFHANASVKKAMIGLRGAWAALGVELNFPVGHSLVTVSPVDFRVAQSADAASVWVGATDRVTGMRWRVQFTLERGSAMLRQEAVPGWRIRRLSGNDTTGGITLCVTLGEDTRFVLPTKLIAGHGKAQIDTWPVGAQGLDRSVPANFPTSVGWFAHESREPAPYARPRCSQTGTVHYADPAEVPGKRRPRAWGRRDEDAHRQSAVDAFRRQQPVRGDPGGAVRQPGDVRVSGARRLAGFYRVLDSDSQIGRDLAGKPRWRGAGMWRRRTGALQVQVLEENR